MAMVRAIAKRLAEKEEGCPPVQPQCSDYDDCEECWTEYILTEDEKK